MMIDNFEGKLPEPIFAEVDESATPTGIHSEQARSIGTPAVRAHIEKQTEARVAVYTNTHFSSDSILPSNIYEGDK